MTYSLIVVGAGNVGTFHAYHALQQGKTVLLLEKDAQPAEATVRNFGQIIPSGMAFDTWFDYGRESARLYRRLQERTDVSVRANGSYYIASDSDEMTLLEELALLLQERDFSCRLLNKEDCLQAIPNLQPAYCVGGLWAGEDLSVEPRLLVNRVRELLRSDWGLDYRFNTAVVGCEVKNDVVEVRTAAGDVFRSDRVAICNGRDFQLLFPHLFAESGISVVKLNMMELVPQAQMQLPGNVLSGLSIRRYESFESCPSRHHLVLPEWQRPYVQGGIHILFKQAVDGSMIVGDSHEYAPVREAASLDFAIRNDLNKLILREAQRMMQLPDWTVQRYWAGYYGQTADGGAFTHVLDERIFIATGIGGKGMTTGPAFARRQVERIFEPLSSVAVNG